MNSKNLSISPNPKPARPGGAARWLDEYSWSLAVLGLFFVLTNGIPLAQWGWMDTEITKKVCVRYLRLAVFCTFAYFALLYQFRRSAFKSLGIVRWVRRISEYPLQLALGLWALYVLVTFSVGWARHISLETRGFDLGIFAQAVWNTTQGDFLFSSIKENICLLGDHFSPALALLTPFYSVWPDPRMLLLIQAIAAGACMPLIAKIAQDRLQHNGLASLFALLFFIYLPSRAALHEDFHPEVLAEPFLLLAFWLMIKRKILACLLCLAFAASTKENMLGITFVFGLWMLISGTAKKTGVLLAVISVLAFWSITHWVIPEISGKPYLYQGFYIHFLKDPQLLMHQIFSGDSAEYVLKVFLPFIFLPLFHWPILILGMPVFFQNLLSNNEVMRSFAYHYMTGLTPFLFISAIYGYGMMTERFRPIARQRHWLTALLCMVALLRSGPSEYFYFYDSLRNTNAHEQHIRNVAATIPSGVSVLTHNNLIPQMVNRKAIYQFDYLTVPTKGQQAFHRQADYVVMERQFWEPGTLPLEETLLELQNLGYRISHEQNGFYVLTKLPTSGEIL